MTGKEKILLVARDLAPKQAFEKLAEEFRVQNIPIICLLGKDSELFDARMIEDESVRVVLTGFSHSEELSKKEREAASAAFNMGIPFGFYADTYDTYDRPAFESFRNTASFLFVVDEEEAQKASFLFPNAEIVVSGNPIWEDFFYPETTYEEARDKLRVSEREICIFCPGGSNLTVNILLFGLVIDAGNKILRFLNSSKSDKRIKIFLAIHPEDPNYKENPKVYDDIIKFSRIPAEILTQEILSSPEAIVGCDVLLESMSTCGIQKAHQRGIIIEILTELALNRKEDLLGGSRSWKLCEKGAAALVADCNTSKIAELVISYSFTPELLEPYLEVQQKLYPIRRKGNSVKAMIETLEKFI